ncbi:MAG: hypothetical protein WCL34_16040 [Methylococcaceae bacterium]|jgi:hypothetical protein
MSEEHLNEAVETPAPEAAKIETVAAEPKANPMADAMASVTDMKENNPKMFYGIVTGVAGIVLMLAMLSGNEKVLPSSAPKSLAAGQKYTLQSPNASAEDGEQTIIRLVATPGAIAAFDDDENKTEECRKFPEGTHVTVLDKQDAFGKKDVFAKVQIDEDVCNGTIGWVLAVNL